MFYIVLWTEIAQSTMGSFWIVLLAPNRDDYSCFAQNQSHSSVQTFIAETTVKTFDVSILPRATRVNIDCLDLIIAKPSFAEGISLGLSCCGRRVVINVYVRSAKLAVKSMQITYCTFNYSQVVTI